MHNDWKDLLLQETKKDYFLNLKNFLVEQKNQNKIIFPSKENIYKAFELAPKDIKVIVLGQDPYHGVNQAHGLSFSVMPGIRPPPSLKNIYKEIEQELKIDMDQNNGYLLPWLNQGVFLLNSILTVEKSLPGSHRNKGWETFTDFVIEQISKNYEGNVYMLWGSYAKEKAKLINKDKNLILTSAHPSPYSANNGFFGNNHFFEANKYLKEKGKQPINWKI